MMAQAPAMGLAACVQRSTVLTQCRGKIPSSRADGQAPFTDHTILLCEIQI